MVHVGGSTSIATIGNTLSNHTATPASVQHDDTTFDSPFSPRSWAWGLQPLLASPCLEDNDFQSNQCTLEVSRRVNDNTIPLTGLGIRYSESNTGIEFLPMVAIPEELINIPRWSSGNSKEVRRHHSASRMESIYDWIVDEELDQKELLELIQSDQEVESHSPWSSALLRLSKDLSKQVGPDTEFKIDDSLAPDTLNMQEIYSTDHGAWSFEKLSAAAGLSVEVLAAQISASAEIALKQISSQDQLPLWSPQRDCTTEWTLPIVDVNMNAQISASSWHASVGVNPADIISDTQPSSVFSPDAQNKALSEELTLQRNLGVDHCVNQSKWFYNLKAEDLEITSEYEPIPFDTSSNSSSSPFHSPLSKITRNPHQSERRHKATKKEPTEPVLPLLLLPYDIETNRPVQFIIDLGTPVLDAHRGIDLEELKAKAERYRLRNDGKDYDKKWLLSFVGKLSERGELLEDFRCYVQGCHQVNKRRDHILIHVGAHLDQRPFKCSHCYARFLRKNECKRHELSHSGARPYACELCPWPSSTFVRQDLLKRHLKRTHNVETSRTHRGDADATCERPTKRAKRS